MQLPPGPLAGYLLLEPIPHAMRKLKLACMERLYVEAQVERPPANSQHQPPDVNEQDFK